MPIDPVTILGVGAGLLSNGANMEAQKAANIMQLQFAEYMYDKQRRDALSDWNMQNAYNSPSAQMQRLAEAGLNPHLVYGKGADNVSTSVRSSQQGSSSPRAAQFNPQSLLLGSQLALQQAQARNINAEAEQKEQMLGFNVLNADLSNMKLQRDIESIIDDNRRKNQLHDFNLKRAFEDVLNLQARTKLTEQQINLVRQQFVNSGLEMKVKELDAKFAEAGIRPGDPLWMRALLEVINSAAGKSVWDLLRSFGSF